MKFFMLVWLTTVYDCPWGLGMAPEPVKKLVCTERRALEYEYVSRESDIIKRLLKLPVGASYTVIEIRGGRHSQRTVIWTPEVK